MRPSADVSAGVPVRWALVDVETTGLRPAQDRVLQIAVMELDERGRQVGAWSTLVDPECDPGPVRVHGINGARLLGAPRFADVVDEIGRRLGGRTLVAHNAAFDYDFLQAEFGRLDRVLPVPARLCTLALNRLLAPPCPDARLATLAAHYGVPSALDPHDALGDVLLLAGVLQASLTSADELGVAPPLVACPPGRADGFPPPVHKQACAFSNPGRWQNGQPLRQGMKVGITGATARPRGDLVRRGAAAGLNMMSNVSRHTSVLVTNELASGSSKARKALAEGVPVIDEETFLRLLAEVCPSGDQDATVMVGPTTAAEPATAPPAPVPEEPPLVAPATVEAPHRPLRGRRVLVLGAHHASCAAARARVVALGGAAAVNHSATVTDVLALPGAEEDSRWRRLVASGLPLRTESWLSTPPADLAALTPTVALGRGHAVDLLPATGWTLAVSWPSTSTHEVDVVAFAVDAQEQVRSDEDFVFYNNRSACGGAVTLHEEGPHQHVVSIEVASLPLTVDRVRVAAALATAGTFADVGPLAVSAAPGPTAAVCVEATLDAATTERALVLADVYRRDGRWRLRAVGQGWDSGLRELAVEHGVDVEEG